MGCSVPACAGGGNGDVGFPHFHGHFIKLDKLEGNSILLSMSAAVRLQPPRLGSESVARLLVFNATESVEVAARYGLETRSDYLGQTASVKMRWAFCSPISASRQHRSDFLSYRADAVVLVLFNDRHAGFSDIPKCAMKRYSPNLDFYLFLRLPAYSQITI